MNERVKNTIDMMETKAKNFISTIKDSKVIETIGTFKDSELVKNAINTIRDSKIYEVIDKATGNFSKQQKLGACGVVGVLTLATVLAVVPPVGVSEGMNAPQARLVAQGEVAVEEGTWVVVIGDEIVLAVNSEAEAEAVFEGIKTYYLEDKENADTAEVSFDRVFSWAEYDEETQGTLEVATLSVDEAVEYIVKGTLNPITYTIQGGDTLWDIAANNNITVDELEEMNPGLSSKALKVGAQINLYEAKQFVNVTTVEKVTSEEVVPYDVVYEETSSMYRGQSEVKTAGVSGTKEVTSEVTKTNGVLVASNVVSEKVVTEPQAQVSLKGTAAIPVYTGGKSIGVLSAPMAHMEVSDYFGSSRGSRRHAGIDLRNPKGTPIYAAADGVVIFASYSGTFGNIVKIDHGGGVHTYYSHCDAMYVSVGDQVTRGQHIAAVGRTGNATGNILHFEVRINGVSQNPLNYL